MAKKALKKTTKTSSKGGARTKVSDKVVKKEEIKTPEKNQIKEEKKLLSASSIIIITFLLGIIIGYYLSGEDHQREIIIDEDDHEHQELSLNCGNLGGTWLEESLECESISEVACKELGGNFNECASACRNTNSEICTMQCVQVCDLTSHHDNNEKQLSQEDHEHIHSHSDHGSHMHEKFEVSENVPTISIEVTKDLKSGYNLEISTENFEFDPKGVSGEHIDNRGHAHLYINGDKVNRLYSNYYHLGDLETGDEVRVTLNTNDHNDYAFNGEVIDSTIKVE